MLDRWLELAGGLVCHQTPERSFFVDHQPLPLCARCTGLYLSVLVGVSLGGWRGSISSGDRLRRDLAVLAWFGVAALIGHAVGEHLGFRASSNPERAMVGAIGGMALGWMLAPHCRFRPPSDSTTSRAPSVSLGLVAATVVGVIVIGFRGLHDRLAFLLGVGLFATYFLLNVALAGTLLGRMPSPGPARGVHRAILGALLLWCCEWVALAWLR